GTVVHFTGSDSKAARVCRTNIRVFDPEDKAAVVDYDIIGQLRPITYGIRDRSVNFEDLQCYDPDQVLKYALQTLGWGEKKSQRYDPIVNNCEHFVTATITGVPFSLQAEDRYDYAHNRPTIGGLLSTVGIEMFRFQNPHPKPTETVYVYRYGSTFYCESYSSPGNTPPTWFEGPTQNGPWRKLHGGFRNPRENPSMHPLKEV